MEKIDFLGDQGYFASVADWARDRNGVLSGTRIAERTIANFSREDVFMLSTCFDPVDSVQDLALQLERLVQGRTGSRIRDLHVDVRSDEVILTGRARSYYAKQLATHAALGAVGPRSLVNAIDVV